MINTYVLVRPNKTCYIIAAENENQVMIMGKNEDGLDDCECIIEMVPAPEEYAFTIDTIDFKEAQRLIKIKEAGVEYNKLSEEIIEIKKAEKETEEEIKDLEEEIKDSKDELD